MCFSTPIKLRRLQIVQEIPLPDALPDAHRTTQDPFAAGQAQHFDHFDFQSLDPNTHLLFIVHSGPNPDKAHFDAQTDGNIVVFNVLLNKVVGLINIPQGSGILVAQDLGKVFVSDAADGIVYVIDEHSPFNIIAKIQLDPLDGPDAIEYDPVDHKIFVADPGSSADPDDANTVLKNQNVAVIDAINNSLITKIPFGLHPPFGDDIGHIQFDSLTHRVYVVTLPLNDQNQNCFLQRRPHFLLSSILTP